MALITIITVVYNGEAHLEATIQSVINVTSKNQHLNHEYFIIDGASKDGTVKIIEKYASKIDYWISEPDKGIYDAMNKGWKKAKKDSYILFLGAGDKILSLPEDLKDDYSKIYFGDVFIGDKLFKSIYNFKLKLGNTLHHQALLVPKTFHCDPPFDLKYKMYADFDFNQRLLKRKMPFEHSKFLTAFALPGGLSAARNDVEMRSVVRKNFGLFFSTLAALYYRCQNLKNLLCLF